MSTTPVAPYVIQIAVQAVLTGDPTLASMITGVFDEPPAGQPFPYISYGQHVDGPYPLFGKGGHQGFFLLDIWSEKNKDECYQILAEVKRLLVTSSSTPPLAASGYSPVTFAYDWASVLKEQEFSLYHMPVRFLTRAVES